MRPSALLFDASDGQSGPGGLGYRNMQDQFSTATTSRNQFEAPSSSGYRPEDDSQATTLNDFAGYACEQSKVVQDAHESDLDSLLDGTGTVVGESLDVSLPGPSQQCTQSTSPPEWEDIPPDVVIKRLKAIPPDVTSSLRIRDFYKSYPSWEKMTQEQKLYGIKPCHMTFKVIPFVAMLVHWL